MTSKLGRPVYTDNLDIVSERKGEIYNQYDDKDRAEELEDGPYFVIEKQLDDVKLVKDVHYSIELNFSSFKVSSRG